MLTLAGTADQGLTLASRHHGIRQACQDATVHSNADLERLPHWLTKQPELLRLISKTLTIHTSVICLREHCSSS